MITGAIKSQIDQIWNAFWSGGISNPLEVIEQITSWPPLVVRRCVQLSCATIRGELPVRRSPERQADRCAPEDLTELGWRDLQPLSALVLEVMCPVTGLFNDLSGGSANVWVHDRITTEDICCTTRYNNVGAVESSPQVCSTATDDRLQTLSMVPPEASSTFTSRYFNCTIPPTDNGEASGIRLYGSWNAPDSRWRRDDRTSARIAESSF